MTVLRQRTWSAALKLLLAILMALAALSLSPAGMKADTEAPQRLGLFHTDQELAIWQSRVLNGPFKSAGDFSSHSPGDWNRIVSNANAFLANPSGDRITSPNQNVTAQHIRMRDAAFVSLVTGNQQMFDAVKTELLAQTSIEEVRLPNWGIVLEDGFFEAKWLVRLLMTYDYIKHGLTPEERSHLDAWFSEAAHEFGDNIEDALSLIFPNRQNEDYSVRDRDALTGRMRNEYTHTNADGSLGHQLSYLSSWYNNRKAAIIEFVALTGVFLDDPWLIKQGKLFVKEMLMFGTYPDGTMGEYERNGDYGNPQSGMTYSATNISVAVLIADALARTGDNELYEYSTSEGLHGTEGGNKNIELIVRNFYNQMDYTIERYHGSVAIENRIDAENEFGGDIGIERYVHSIWFTPGNVYWQDDYFRDSSVRKNGPPFPADHVAGNGISNAWGGSASEFPGVLFMYAQLDGEVWPYPNAVNPSNADLAGLTIDHGSLTPAFTPGNANYSVVVANDVEQLTVRPTPEDPEASATVNGAAPVDGEATVDLDIGGNVISVEVASRKGTTKTYTLHVVRAEAGGAAASAPGKPVLSSDNGYDTGLNDSDYTVTMNMWWGGNGVIYNLYENGKWVDTQFLQDHSTQAQQAQTYISGKANGTYVYTCELINLHGVTPCDPMTVEVEDSLPGVPVLSNDNWDSDDAFTVAMNMWWGTNGTEYRLYENGTLIDVQQLTDNSPGAQSAVTVLADRPNGLYEYRAELANAFGVTESAIMQVQIENSEAGYSWWSRSDWTLATHSLGAGNTAALQTIEFDLQRLEARHDGVIGYTDSSTNVTGYSSFPIIFRTNPDGNFDVRNGGTYSALAVVPHLANVKYHVRIEVDLTNKTVDVWVTPEGEAEIQIADDYAFRSDAPAMDDIGQISVQSNDDQTYQITNHKFTSP